MITSSSEIRKKSIIQLLMKITKTNEKYFHDKKWSNVTQNLKHKIFQSSILGCMGNDRKSKYPEACALEQIKFGTVVLC